ncbi:motility regulator [Pseudomonas asuensis]|uniref:Motility regulator n=1 Tax=Pseudomonas asuensis TaxID=1825787 RepID=A0ABQ2GID0_9PSED|nr:EAL domain-containing protein [Pseudomonas asuensis]GGL96836.1 motility regulator [Pseudomonas asuensis]
MKPSACLPLQTLLTRSPAFSVLKWVLAGLILLLLGALSWQLHKELNQRNAMLGSFAQEQSLQKAEHIEQTLAFLAHQAITELHTVKPEQGADALPANLRAIYPEARHLHWIPAEALIEPSTFPSGLDAKSLDSLLRRTETRPFYYGYAPEEDGYVLLRQEANGWWLISGEAGLGLSRVKSHSHELIWTITDKASGATLAKDTSTELSASDKQTFTLTLDGTDWLLGSHLSPSVLSWQTLFLWRIITFVLLTLCVSLLVYCLQRERSGFHLASRSSRQSLRLMMQALNAVDECVLVTYEEGRLLYLNRKASLLLGIEQSDAEQHTLRDLVPAADLPTPQESEKEHIVELRQHDGQNRLFAISRYGVGSTGTGESRGGFTGYAWILRDVTEQQQALRTIESTRQRYQGIFEGINTGICVLDFSRLHQALLEQNISNARAFYHWIKVNPSKGHELLNLIRITEMNQMALTLLGITSIDQAQANLIGRNEPNINGKRVKMIAALAEGQQTLDVEGRLVTAQGERYLWFSVHLPPAETGYEAVPLSITDVSQRKRTELSLIERERFWSDLVKAAPDTLYTYDLKTHTIDYQNHPLGLKLGYSEAELERLGADALTTLLHPDDTELFERLRTMRQVIQEGQVNDCLIRWRHKNGHWCWFDLREQAFQRDSEGQMRQIIGLALDVTEMVEANDLLRDQERRYRLLAESISDVIFSTDQRLAINYISPSAENLLGYKLETLYALNPYDLTTHSQQLKKLRHWLKKLRRSLGSSHRMAEVRQEASQVIILDCLHADGHKLSLEMRLETLWDKHGRFEGLLGICRNITAQRRAEKDMRMAATVFDHSAAAILVTDPAGYIVRVNQMFTRMTGYESEEVIDQQPRMLCADLQEANQLSHIMNHMAVQGSWEGELWQKRKDGEPYPSWIGITGVRDDEGDLVSFVCFFVDISERKASERHIHRLAYYDALTLLPNRTLFQDRLHSALEQAAHHASWVVLMFLDLDRFKPINDSLGHAAGDRMLKEVAVRLTACVGTEDSVARMGGDEFTLLLANLGTREDAMACAIRVAENILESLSEAFILESREFFVSASIGIALSPQDGSELSQLMKNADTAMYHAKEMGKNNFQFYQAEMNARALERIELEADLRHALLQNEFTLHYQPQYRCSNSQLTGLEALLRWNHPRRGNVSPVDFIPVLEETGLIIQVGDWVIKEACRQLRVWHDNKVRIPKVSVNLSARQFADNHLGEHIAKILQEVGLPPACLELELTESILMQNVDDALNTLRSLKELGVCISVDDFGTGYSSLNYLKQLPIDILKIDRSFVDGLPYGEQDAQIARAIIAMAHSLNLSVIAEGVENEEQLKFLRDHECDEVQGYLFDKPLSPEMIETRLRLI